MKPRLKLCRAARRRLLKLDHKRPNADVRVRIRVIQKVADGLNCNGAAREVGCVPSTAIRTAGPDIRRVLRAGAWSLDVVSARASYRLEATPGTRRFGYGSFGCRVVARSSPIST